MVVVAVKQLRHIPLWDTEIFSQPAFVAVCLRHKILRRVVKFNLGFSFPLFRTFQYFFSFHIAPFFRKTHFLEALKGPLFLQPSTTLLAHLQHAPFCLASSRPMKKQSRYFYLFSFIKLRNKKSDATKITCFSDKYKQSDTKKERCRSWHHSPKRLNKTLSCEQWLNNDKRTRKTILNWKYYVNFALNAKQHH